MIMQKILKISEAVAIGIHACVILSKLKEGERLEAQDISEKLKVSYDHLSKVLQRLVKAGFIESMKGPKGGFYLSLPANSITLRNIYECLEGPMKLDHCLFGKSICSAENCMLGSLINKINQEVLAYFSNTKISDLQA